jgi:putative nucleotidyltransferase with HDIG domain
MNNSINRWFSLRTKIILPYLVLAMLLAIGAAYIGTRVVFDSIEERFVNQLIEAGRLSSEWMVREENRLLGTLRLVAYADGIPAAIRSEDAEKLREIVYPIGVNAQEEAIDILDTKGITLFSMHHRTGGKLEEYEFSRGDAVFQRASFVLPILQGRSDAGGDKYAGIIQLKREPYLYVSSPIHDLQGQLIGSALVGKSLTSIVRQIREATLAQVTLYDSDGQALATTLLQAEPLTKGTTNAILTNKDRQSLIRDLTSTEIEYREVLGAWEVRQNTTLGLMGASFAKNFLVRFSQNTWVQILLSIGIAFLLVLIIGLYVSHRISSPILRLERAATEVAHGNLNVQVPSVGSDEIAILTQGFNRMVSNLARSQGDLVTAYDSTLEGWVKALDLRDRDTTGHSLRVAQLTVQLATEMNLDQIHLEYFRRGALLHDIGKMAIPDEILLKPGPLDEAEWTIMRQHPNHAIQMLKGISFLQPMLDIPYCHHERWDGSGYPRNLKAEEIPIAARIFAVVDVWDSLTSDRPYRSALSAEQARRIIELGSGNIFEPQVVQAFLKMLDGSLSRAGDDETAAT